jgi:uncharacterized membrane protein
MLYSLLKTVHVLAILVWVGGMVFAHFCLRPAVAELPPPQRLTLMSAVLGRFFRLVLVAAPLAFLSGGWMIGRTARQVSEAGVHFQMPLGWAVMAALGTVMVLVFFHIRFALYPRLARAVQASDWPAGAAALGQVRQWVLANLGLSAVVLLAALWRF